MPRIISKVYIISLLIVSILSIFAYLYYKKDNPINMYMSNKAEGFFKLETLKLDGRYRSSKEHILSALSLKKDSPILFLDLSDLRKKILIVPWIKNASISRKLPNEIHVKIEEYQPSAIWEYRNEIYVLDEEGYQIEKVSRKDGYDDLLHISGESADINVESLLLALKQYPSLQDRIDYTRFIGKRRWDLYLEEGILIKLPMGDINDALLELDQHLKDYNLIEKGHKKIDLRVKGEISTDRIFKGK